MLKVRAFLPEAEEAWIVDDETGRQYPMEKIHKQGFLSPETEEGKRSFPIISKSEAPDGDARKGKTPMHSDGY